MRWQTQRRLEELAEKARVMAREMEDRARRGSPVPEEGEEEEDSGTYATILPTGDGEDRIALPQID